MKKNTLAKWVLAGAAMVVAFACQAKNPPETSGEDDSSCPCTSACSSMTTPAVKDDKTALNNQVEVSDSKAEEISTYTIEIEDAEEVASSANDVSAPVVAEASQDAPVAATLQDQASAKDTTLNESTAITPTDSEE